MYTGDKVIVVKTVKIWYRQQINLMLYKTRPMIDVIIIVAKLLQAFFRITGIET